MESELGFNLLAHNKNKFSLTPEGEDFLPFAIKICDIRNEYTEIFKNRGKTRRLVVAACHFTSSEDEAFSNAILRLSGEYPDCLIRTPPVLSFDNLEELIIENDNNKVSCLIAKELSDGSQSLLSSSIRTKTLLSWPVSVLTRTDHPFAGREVTLEDIEKEHLISLGYPTFANALAVRAFRTAGLIPMFSYTLNSFRSICDFVIGKKGIFLVTEPVDTSALPKDLCLTKITPELTTETFVAYNRLFSREHEQRFIELLQEEFKGCR